jgi:hypothetical protein
MYEQTGLFYVKITFTNCDHVVDVCIGDGAQIRKRIVDQDTLKVSVERAGKVLEFCSNVKSIELLRRDAVLSIIMELDGTTCTIKIFQDYIMISWYNGYLIIVSGCSHAEGFDKFLELFSKTPFYKRPESIKVSARNCSD